LKNTNYWNKKKSIYFKS